MRSLEFWVLGCNVLLLSWIDHCTGMTLSPCGSDNTAEVVQGKTDNTFTCSGLGSGQQADWTLLYQTSVFIAGSCPAVSSGGSCTRGDLGVAFTPRRTSSTDSTLTVDATRLNIVVVFQSGTLKCADTSNEASCQTDYVVPARGSCSVQLGSESSRFQLTGSCSLQPGAVSLRGRYKCEWYRKHKTSPESLVASITLSASNYQTACLLNGQSVSAVAGQYTYTVKLLPGRNVVNAGNVNVVRPSPPTISSCSPNGTVPANASVTCTCTASSVGQPQGRLKWVKVADGSQITVGSYGTTTLKMTSQTLTLSDHDVNKFRCDVEWVEAVRGEGFRASVGYPPSQTSLRLNSNQGNETVNENQSVTFGCATSDGRPIPIAKLVSRDSRTELHSESSPLTYSVRARCEDSGVYVCAADNGMGPQATSVARTLTVQCSPRGEEDIGVVNFNGDPVSVHFEVTAFPTPTEMNFTFLGSSANDTGSSQRTTGCIRLEGTCVQQEAVLFKSTCSVTVSSVTTEEAAGFYQVTVTNSLGSAHFRLQVIDNEDTTIGRAKAETQSYFGVAVGLGVVLALIVIFGVIVVVVSVLWLKRHQWILPCTDVDQLRRTPSKDLPTSERSRTITESCIQTEQLEDTGGAATRGPYDSLQMSDIGLRSVYSEIGHSEGRDTRSASGEAGGLYENTLR